GVRAASARHDVEAAVGDASAGGRLGGAVGRVEGELLHAVGDGVHAVHAVDEDLCVLSGLDAHAARIRERELVVLVGAGDALAVEPFGEGLDAGARVLWGPVAHAVLPVAREGHLTGARAGRRAVRWLPGGGVGQARAQGIALGVGHVTVRVEPGVGEVAREHPAAAVHVVAHVVSVGVASTAAGVVVGALAIEDDHVV